LYRKIEGQLAPICLREDRLVDPHIPLPGQLAVAADHVERVNCTCRFYFQKATATIADV
jgi:hypothetical protein